MATMTHWQIFKAGVEHATAEMRLFLDVQPKGMPQQQAWVWNPASLAWEAVQTPWHRHSGALYAYGPTPPDPLAVPSPAPAPEHVPVSPEHEAKIDAAVGLVLLPPIRVDAETYAAIEKLSKANGMIVQATVRDMIWGACRATGETPSPAVRPRRVSDDEIRAWVGRHDFGASLGLGDYRAMVEDARTIELAAGTSKPPVQPTGEKS